MPEIEPPGESNFSVDVDEQRMGERTSVLFAPGSFVSMYRAATKGSQGGLRRSRGTLCPCYTASLLPAASDATGTADSPMTSEQQQLLRDTLREAVGHLQAGQFGEAESLARDLVERYPESADAIQMLGYLACRGGRFEEGIRHLSRALEIEPDSSQTLCHLGNAH